MRTYLQRRQKVLDLLYQSRDDYISGEQLSNQLSVSRTTIWKYIKYFRQAGYKIDSSSRLGYRLISSPDILLPEEIHRGLETEKAGAEIFHADQLKSTNQVAKEKAKSGFKEGTVVIAEEQTGGQGRLNRKFFSPQGGIWLSLVLAPELKPMLAARTTYLASLAVVETIEQVLGLAAKIKWPNDILIADKKVTGILTEMGAELDQINYLIMGIGINANFNAEDAPSQLSSKLTSLQSELGGPIDRVGFVQSLFQNIEEQLPLLTEFDQLVAQWKDYSLTLGREVEIKEGATSYVGQALEIAPDGGLILEQNGRQKKVYSGQVSLRH